MKAVPSTTHGMIKVPGFWEEQLYAKKVSKIIPAEMRNIYRTRRPIPFGDTKSKRERIFKVAINPEHPEQTERIKAKLPMLTAPEEQEELIVYLAASKEALWSAVINDRKERLAVGQSSLTTPSKEEEKEPAPGTVGNLVQDGSLLVDGYAVQEVILTDPEGMEFTYALRFQFETTNNEAEYEAN
ncbi:hypothetical protein Tco_1237265 [Tanacetum coccineum]